MADAYRTWLEEQVAYWHGRCLESAAERGRPASEGTRFADQTLREILDAYQECLDKYNALAAQTSPAL